MKKNVICIKDFHTFMNKENLIFNGYSEEEAKRIDKKGIFKFFEKGKKYRTTGVLKTLSGNDIVCVDSILKAWNWEDEKNYLFETFYVEERSKKHLEEIKKFEEDYGHIKDDEKLKDMYDSFR